MGAFAPLEDYMKERKIILIFRLAQFLFSGAILIPCKKEKKQTIFSLGGLQIAMVMIGMHDSSLLWKQKSISMESLSLHKQAQDC